ncbi:MAG: type VI secretion system contractile sheath large subunit [Chromatiaceae bacterium]
MSGRIEVALELGERSGARWRKARDDGAMRILVMGDFSGRGVAQAGVPSLETLPRPIRLDIDNLDDVLAALEPQVTLPFGDHWGQDLVVDVTCLDDFHPDALYERVPIFRRLRDLRGRLLEPATFARAAAELRDEIQVFAPTPMAGAETPENDASTVERLLGKRPGHTQVAERRSEVAELLRLAAAPHLSPETPHQELYVRALDDIAGDLMRSILRHPRFQALEGAWRSAHQLVSRLETGEALEVWLLDLGRAQLLADVCAAGNDPSSTRLHRMLMHTAPGMPEGRFWGLLVGAYTFGLSTEDVTCLTALGGIASEVGAPFFAAADPAILGCASLVETPSAADWLSLDPSSEARWQGLRRSPFARWVGLALPRVLLRLPYGKATDPIESFEFEELAPVREHSAYLWGNPAFVCAVVVARAYIAAERGNGPRHPLDVDDLPAHAYREDGETKLQACAETYLSESTAETIASRGIIPLLSYRNRNAVRVWQLRSLADSSAGLASAWT